MEYKNSKNLLSHDDKSSNAARTDSMFKVSENFRFTIYGNLHPDCSVN